MIARKMPSTKTILSTAASLAASAMLIRSIANEFLPAEFQHYYISAIRNLSNYLSSQFTIVIDEFRGHAINELFQAADKYLGTITTPSTQRVKLGKAEDEKNLAITADTNVEIVDIFEDVQVKWMLVCMESKGYETAGYGQQVRDLTATLRAEVRSYELSFNKKYKEKVLNSYLPYVLERAKIIEEEGKAIKLHTVRYQYWDAKAIKIDHPMTFETLAMDTEIKKALIEDLNNYINGKEFYRRVGKAWKRGYLLHGPPGTGKSSLIAAMANYLNYDIYDLDLTDVQCNSDLRCLLLGMSSRSILVIEDIDCSIKLQNRESEDEDEDENESKYPENKVTLSGILNFIDGLWSCCGSERLIIFTTNHKDRLDPALLRPGRMDMHIHMSYCTFSSFKQLALNYLGLCNHELFKQIEEILGEAKVTPAEVAGELMKSSNAEVSLQGLLKFLKNKMTEKEKKETTKTLEAHKEENGK
ncbi:unnamed protein product [Ilex paraguariensis]|uniref:AAA+ ATPase domain-containing protein n=1 Tax=Ilex paraguariensis TaxID=185542 RepID=A0ABC8S7D5_9AQUA